MFGAYAAAAVLLAASVVIGLALWRICGWERASFSAPAVGFALLLAVMAVTALLPGRTVTSAVLLGVLFVGSILVLWAAPYPLGPRIGDALLLMPVSLALVGLPFAVSGHFGVLGVGDNNDMSVHLGAAYWLQTHAIQQDVMLVKPGYPLGPHAIAGTLATMLGVSTEQAFMGVTMVVPALTALVAFGGLERLSRPARWFGALLTGFAYMAASYYAQAAFKETILGLILLAFVLGLREFAGEVRWPRARQAVPLGLLGAGAVYTYSYPGLFWPVAALVFAWGATALRGGIGGLVPRSIYLVRDAAWPLAAGAVALTVAVLPDIARVVRFAGSQYAHEPSYGLGNLEHPISPAQTLGVWLAPDFRFNPNPRWLTVIGLALAGAALAWAMWRAWRDEDVTAPAALVGAVVVWAVATQTKNPYNAAKGLAIMSPLVMLLVVGALLAPRRQLRFARPGIARMRAPVAALALGLAAFSSFLALRDAPVGPRTTWDELGGLRSRIAGQRTIALYDDDFSLWELRGAIVGRVRDLYDPLLLPTNRAKPFIPGQAVDFDTLAPSALESARYVVTTRAPYASEPPRNFRLAASTPTYELWERTGPVIPRSVLPEQGSPGATLDCSKAPGRSLARKRGIAGVLPAPVVSTPFSWSRVARGAGDSASQALRLPRGRWDISLQYVSRQPLTVSGPGLNTTLPANLARFGPFYLAGTVPSDGRTPVTLTARMGRLPAFGRLLGSRGYTRGIDSPDWRALGAVAATRHGARETSVPLSRACGRYVDWYRLSSR